MNSQLNSISRQGLTKSIEVTRTCLHEWIDKPPYHRACLTQTTWFLFLSIIRYMQKQHSSSLENAARYHLGSKAVLNINTARDGGILMTFRSPDLEKDLMNCPALDTL